MVPLPQAELCELLIRVLLFQTVVLTNSKYFLPSLYHFRCAWHQVSFLGFDHFTYSGFGSLSYVCYLLKDFSSFAIHSILFQLVKELLFICPFVGLQHSSYCRFCLPISNIHETVFFLFHIF